MKINEQEPEPLGESLGKEPLQPKGVVSLAWDTLESHEPQSEEKLVVFFDICSSSRILEDLYLSDELKKYRDLLIFIKEFLLDKTHSGVCETYKFIGDGWVLLFPPKTSGKDFTSFLVELAQLFRDELEQSVVHWLQKMPPVLGLTFGVDRGRLIKVIMNNQPEYLGRPLNIASRLQGAVKDGDSNPAYKALISKPTFERLKIPQSFQVEAVKRDLRNIQLGENYECIKLLVLSPEIRAESKPK